MVQTILDDGINVMGEGFGPSPTPGVPVATGIDPTTVERQTSTEFTLTGTDLDKVDDTTYAVYFGEIVSGDLTNLFKMNATDVAPTSLKFTTSLNVGANQGFAVIDVAEQSATGAPLRVEVT